MSDEIETTDSGGPRLWCPECEAPPRDLELVELCYCDAHAVEAQVGYDGPGIYTRREKDRLNALQRMIDRLDHRIADPTYRKSDWMLAERSALAWAMRILGSHPWQPLGNAVLRTRTREARTSQPIAAGRGS